MGTHDARHFGIDSRQRAHMPIVVSAGVLTQQEPKAVLRVASRTYDDDELERHRAKDSPGRVSRKPDLFARLFRHGHCARTRW